MSVKILVLKDLLNKIFVIFLVCFSLLVLKIFLIILLVKNFCVFCVDGLVRCFFKILLILLIFLKEN